MDQPDPPTHPYEVFLFSAFTLGGIAGSIAPAQVASPAISQLPPAFVTVWYVGLLVGGLASLAGLVIEGTSGKLVKRSALLLQAGLCMTYVLVLVSYSGWRGMFFGTILGGIAVSNLILARRIRRPKRSSRIIELTRPEDKGGR